MNCKKIRILLSAFVDNELNKKEHKYVNEHLRTCTRCANELEYLKQMKVIFAHKEIKEPIPFFETRLFNKIKEKREKLEFVTAVRKTIWISICILFILFGIFVAKTSLNMTQNNIALEYYLLQDTLNPLERKIFFESKISEKELIIVLYNEEVK